MASTSLQAISEAEFEISVKSNDDPASHIENMNFRKIDVHQNSAQKMPKVERRTLVADIVRSSSLNHNMREIYEACL